MFGAIFRANLLDINRLGYDFGTMYSVPKFFIWSNERFFTPLGGRVCVYGIHISWECGKLPFSSSNHEEPKSKALVMKGHSLNFN